MEIQYLKNLNNNLNITRSGGVMQLMPISENEIVSLEHTYNNGNQFPTVLRELLYIAGYRCYLLDYGINDSQDELQQDARSVMDEYGASISRPFYVIDVYNRNEQFLFVYLDESQTDPDVYEAYLPGFTDNDAWIRMIKSPLSQYINSSLNKILSGYNPF